MKMTDATVELQGAFIKIPCLLFDDLVTRRLCLLRRHELHGKGALSCRGCTSLMMRHTSLPHADQDVRA